MKTNFKRAEIAAGATLAVAAGAFFAHGAVTDGHRNAAVTDCLLAQSEFHSSLAPLHEPLAASRGQVERGYQQLADAETHATLVSVVNGIDEHLVELPECAADLSADAATVLAAQYRTAAANLAGSHLELGDALGAVEDSHGVWQLGAARDGLAEAIATGQAAHSRSDGRTLGDSRDALQAAIDQAQALVDANQDFLAYDADIRAEFEAAASAIEAATAAVEQDELAWQTEQARIEAERLAAERRAAEARAQAEATLNDPAALRRALTGVWNAGGGLSIRFNSDGMGVENWHGERIDMWWGLEGRDLWISGEASDTCPFRGRITGVTSSTITISGPSISSWCFPIGSTTWTRVS
jgi:hypothetical protein